MMFSKARLSYTRFFISDLLFCIYQKLNKMEGNVVDTAVKTVRQSSSYKMLPYVLHSYILLYVKGRSLYFCDKIISLNFTTRFKFRTESYCAAFCRLFHSEQHCDSNGIFNKLSLFYKERLAYRIFMSACLSTSNNLLTNS
jgi:hypothetical protein